MNVQQLDKRQLFEVLTNQQHMFINIALKVACTSDEVFNTLDKIINDFALNHFQLLSMQLFNNKSSIVLMGYQNIKGYSTTFKKSRESVPQNYSPKFELQIINPQAFKKDGPNFWENKWAQVQYNSFLPKKITIQFNDNTQKILEDFEYPFFICGNNTEIPKECSFYNKLQSHLWTLCKSSEITTISYELGDKTHEFTKAGEIIKPLAVKFQTTSLILLIALKAKKIKMPKYLTMEILRLADFR